MLVTESDDRLPGDAAYMGWGMTTGTMNTAYTGTIVARNNILAHNASLGSNQSGFTLALARGIAITGNIIYKWQNPFSGTTVGNVITPNTVDTSGTAIQYFDDPTRTVAKYSASLGKAGSLAAFLAEARLQSKENWRPQFTASAVNNYIRAGFAKSDPVVAITSPTQSVVTISGNSSITISASAKHASGIASITVLADSRSLATCTNVTTCSGTWQGENISQGGHTLRAIAMTKDGKQATASLTILVWRI